MPNTNTQAKGIKGYIPALDPKVVNQPHVVAGRNFLMSIEGPYAGFATRVLSKYPFVSAGSVQTFETEQGWWWACDTGIYAFSEASLRFRNLFACAPPQTSAPWSYTNVGNIDYFCRAGIGVVSYNPETDNWALVSHAELPQDPQYITRAFGRLVVVGASRIAWSALDDGTDFTSSLETGAGSQGLSMVGGAGLAVRTVADGVIVFTTSGILHGQFTDIGTTFRWTVLSTQRRLLNAFCVTVVWTEGAELSHVFLDARAGLFVCNGTEPTPYQPLFSDYLLRAVYPRFRSLEVRDLRLFYSQVTQHLVVSVGNPAVAGYMTTAYALYVPRGEWGIFSSAHSAFVDFSLQQESAFFGDRWGYVDLDGHAHFMIPNSGQCEIVREFTGVPWAVIEQPANKLLSGVWQAGSAFRVAANNFHALQAATAAEFEYAARHYTQSPPVPMEPAVSVVDDVVVFPAACVSSAGLTQWVFVLRPDAFAPLDAYVDVGLFRLSSGEHPDEVSMITDVAIGVSLNGVAASVEDWNTAADEVEDWNLLQGTEDWGLDVAALVDYVAEIIGSADGNTVDTLDALQLTKDANSVEYYACFNHAIFHRVRVAAQTTGQTFHLRYLELSGNVAGRL